MPKITPFLMFEGQAEEAMNFYIPLFKNSKIVSIARYGKEGPGTEGTVMHAVFQLDGQEFMAIDSAIKHGFTFTPALSFFVQCETVAEVDDLFAKLSEGGQALMPLGEYPFSAKFGWAADRFGISWQVSLAVK